MEDEHLVSLCPKVGTYGVQIPKGTWHTVEVYKPSAIFEAMAGKYILQR